MEGRPANIKNCSHKHPTRLRDRTFSKLQLVKDCGFTSSVETDHEDSHLLFAELL
jgi:hypothetical protein